MKTVKVSGEVKRVSDTDAQKLVADGKAIYCPRSEWKKLHPTTKKEKKEDKK